MIIPQTEKGANVFYVNYGVPEIIIGDKTYHVIRDNEVFAVLEETEGEES